jgi:hypothetical protein
MIIEMTIEEGRKSQTKLSILVQFWSLNFIVKGGHSGKNSIFGFISEHNTEWSQKTTNPKQNVQFHLRSCGTDTNY